MTGPDSVDYSHERHEHPTPVEILIRTKVPSKWRFVDLETGDVWQWDELHGAFSRVAMLDPGVKA